MQTTARIVLEVPIEVALPAGTDPKAPSNRFDEIFLLNPMTGRYVRFFIGLSDDGSAAQLKSESETESQDQP